MIRSKPTEEVVSDSVFSRPIPGGVVNSTAPFPNKVESTKADEETPVAVIGPKIRFKGELVGEEDLLIQGHFDGTIDLKGHHLIIGEQGVVKANVLAKNIIIKGTVEGDIFGQERISILSSSNVNGNLVADRVTLEDGAKFKGSIDMEINDRKHDFEKFNANSMLSKSSSGDTKSAKSNAAPVSNSGADLTAASKDNV